MKCFQNIAMNVAGERKKPGNLKDYECGGET